MYGLSRIEGASWKKLSLEGKRKIANFNIPLDDWRIRALCRVFVRSFDPRAEALDNILRYGIRYVALSIEIAPPDPWHRVGVSTNEYCSHVGCSHGGTTLLVVLSLGALSAL